MAKILGKAMTLASAIAFVGCSAGMSVDDKGGTNTVDGTGSVDFNLDIPNGESIDEILLHLVCADGVDQNHVLDVVDGEVVAGFGGLTPGQCTATMTSQTPDGTDCIGEEIFTVVEAVTTPVTVTLMCQGVNTADGGAVRIDTEFQTKSCGVDRIRKIWAIPANLLEGESTSIEVESWPGTLVETANPATWSFEVVSGGSLSVGGTCEGDSCQEFTCGAVPVGSPIDPGTGLPTNVVTVEVTVEDDDCYDTETVFVECAQASVCGDGTANGLEECDGTDGVTLPSECGPAGDADECQIRECGDGLVNTAAEECDGTDGVTDPLTQACDSSCQLGDLPYCGDNIINDGADLPGAEQCDGTGLPYAGAVCNATCQIVPFCGNGVEEGTEACDLGEPANGPFPATCSDTCTENEAPNLCLDCLEVSAASTQVANCQANTSQAGCNNLLECLTTSGCYYDEVNAVSVASDCYCGTGVVAEDCEAAGFTPTGACLAEMNAIYLPTDSTPTNAEALSFVYNAFQLMNLGVNVLCSAECQF